MALFKRDPFLGIKTLLLHEREALDALLRKDRGRFAEALTARARAVERLRAARTRA